MLPTPPLRGNLVFLTASLLLVVLFLYSNQIRFKLPAVPYDRPIFATDTQEKWSKNGYRRFTSSVYLGHENATRTLRG